jgi:glutamate dehydrogenase
MRKTYAGDIHGHRLRREIIATVLANEAINRGGPAFVSTLTDATGFLSADVVKAAVLALDGFDLPRIYGEIDALDNRISGAVQNRLYQEVGRIFAVVAERALRTRASEGAVADAVARLRDGLQKLRGTMRAAISSESAEEARLKSAGFIESGIPAKLAEEIAELSMMTLVPEIMQIATVTGEPLNRTAQGYFAVTETLRVNRLLAAADRVPATEQFEAMALTRAVADIATARRDITVAALVEQKRDRNPVLAWQEQDRERVSRAGDQLKLLTEKGETTLAKITVAAGLLSDLARGRAK